MTTNKPKHVLLSNKKGPKQIQIKQDGQHKIRLMSWKSAEQRKWIQLWCFDVQLWKDL